MKITRYLVMLSLVAMVLPIAPAVAASDDGVDFKVHGEVRFRGEYVSNYTDFNDDAPVPPAVGNDDDFDFFPYRVRVGIKATFTDNLWGYAELQTADAAGLDNELRDVLFSNNDNIDFYQGYIKMTNVAGKNLDLKFGRQELTFDDEFLLGDLDFYNGISHDGVRARWNFGPGPLDIFWYRLDEGFQNDDDDDLIGGHWGWDDVLAGGDAAVYGYLFRFDEVSGINKIQLMVIGGRLGSMNYDETGFLWNAQVALQTGELTNSDGTVTACGALLGEDCDISSTGFEGLIGYNWDQGNHDQRVWGRVYFASGDDDPTDDDLEAFDPLFQDFHNRLGIADAVVGSNITAISFGYEWMTEKQSIMAEFFNFALNEDDAGSNMSVFGPTTNAFNAGSASVPGRFTNQFAIGAANAGEDDLGQELDAVYRYWANDHLTWEAGLALFMPGDAVKLVSGGQDDSASRIYGQVRLRY